MNLGDGEGACQAGAHLADDAGGGLTGEVSRLTPGEAGGDPIKETGGVHVSGAGRVDGLGGHAFDGDDGILNHED